MIDHLDHNLQIIACAGAGKTEAVAQRVVAQLQLPEVTPENVVAFTFNESAAAELKDRIATRYEEATGSRDGLADCYVGTIHGYCLELLQQNAFDALSFSVLNQIQQNLLISRASRKSGLTDLGFHRYFPAKYADLLSILREADVDEDKLGGSEAEASLHKYLDLLADKHYFDFTAILSEAVQLLEDDDAFRGRVAGKVKFLTVDEYQDVNPVQERLVRGLVDLNATVTVVGDDDQLLYAWRGSQVSNILGFDGRYDDVQIEKLEQNYRSSRGVVDFARHVIETNATRLDKSMVSAGRQAYEAGDIEVIEFEDHIEEAEHIAARIQSLIGTPFRDKPESADRGLSYSDFAVLVRVKKLIESIAEALEAADIRYVVGGVSSLFRAPEAEAARQLFFYLDGRLTDDELAAAWKAAALGSTDAEIAQLVELAKSGRRDIEKGEGRFGIYNLQRSYLDALTALELREPKIATAHKDDGARKAEVAFYNLGKFSEVISDFEQIYFQSAPADKYKSFADFLDYQAEDIYPEGWLEARYVEPDAVQILTIHQAKGLQWPAVFVPGLTKGRFPPQKPGGINLWTKIPHGAVRNQGDYENDEEDERRLLYVAQTRAKKYLTVSRAPYPAGKTMKRNPSWLWDEAFSAFAQVSDADSAPPQEKLEPTPRREVADVTLSFSELKYAFECPYSFKLRFLYGFNPPIAEALGYGKGLHDALFE